MKKLIVAATVLFAATSAEAQTVIVPPAGFIAEKMNACRQYGEMSAEAFSLIKGMSKPTERVWQAARDLHPIVGRVVDAMRAGRVHDQQAAYTLGVAYCYDYIDEQAAKPHTDQGRLSSTSSTSRPPDSGKTQTSMSPPSPEMEKACQSQEKAAEQAFAARHKGVTYETMMAAVDSTDDAVGKVLLAYSVRSAFRHTSSAEVQRDVKAKCLANIENLVRMQLGGIKALSLPD